MRPVIVHCWAIVLLASLPAGVTSAQVKIGADFVRRLADQSAREAAVLSLSGCARGCVEALIGWTRKPPGGVSKHELKVGVAQLFGYHRAKAGIPFLIENLMLDKPAFSYSPRIWTRVHTVAEDRLPCLGALVRMGPEATRALIEASRTTADFDRRAALTHAISRIGDSRGRAYLQSLVGELETLRRLAETPDP